MLIVSEWEPASDCVMFSQSKDGFSWFFMMHELNWFLAWEGILDTDCLGQDKRKSCGLEDPSNIFMLLQSNKAEEYWVRFWQISLKKRKTVICMGSWILTAQICSNVSIKIPVLQYFLQHKVEKRFWHAWKNVYFTFHFTFKCKLFHEHQWFR